MREAADHFRAANDLRSLAEAEYQRGWVEFNLLFRISKRRAAPPRRAQLHFRAVDDELDAQRASLLLALAEINLATDKTGTRAAKRDSP